MKHYKRLTPEQRYTLQCLGRQPGSQASIARILGVHPTNVGREFRRAGMNRETYCQLTAQQGAERGGGEALAERVDHAAGDEDVFHKNATADAALVERPPGRNFRKRHSGGQWLKARFVFPGRSTEFSMERGHKIASAMTKINTFLLPALLPRAAITSGGKGVGDLVTEMNAQPSKEQTVEDRAVDVASARTDLRVGATTVDRLNKRYYDKLSAEARTNEALAEALANITTTSGNLPGTLGIRTLLQGGVNGLQLLVSFENGTYTTGATSIVESGWLIDSSDRDG